MRAIQERSFKVGPCTLWQEDLQELATILRVVAEKGISIKTDRYEYDSIEEMFSSEGPYIRKLEIDCVPIGPSVDIGRFSNRVYTFGRDDTSVTANTLRSFFAVRTTPISYLKLFRYHLVLLSVLAASCIVLGAFQRGPATAIFLSFFVSIIFFAVVRFMGRHVVWIKNYSKRQTRFTRRDRVHSDVERAAFAVGGGIVTLLVSKVWAMLVH
jgi:hypothetical protein